MSEKSGEQLEYEEIEALRAERDRLRGALERIAKSNPTLPPASRFIVIAREALGQGTDTEIHSA